MWECKFCRILSEDTNTSCWSCNGKKEDVELLEGEKPEPVTLRKINNSALRISRKKRSLAFKIGLLLMILGFGGWIIAAIVREAMDPKELIDYAFANFPGAGGAPAWFNLLVLSKAYGIFVGIAGVVLLVIGISLDQNVKR